MSRLKADMINDDNYYVYMKDIWTDTAWELITALRDIYVADFYPVPEPNFLAYNLMSISFFFNTKYQRLYMTYKLDDNRTVKVRTPDEIIYNKIYDRLRCIPRDNDIKLSIIGVPTAIPENSMNRSYGNVRESYANLRIDTQTIWTNIPGPKGTHYTYFIEDASRLKDDIAKKNMSDEEVQEYCNKVVQLNKQYIQIPIPDYYLAFNKYKELYKEYFDRDLYPIEEWRRFTLYFDVKHNYDEENLDKEYHNIGHIHNWDRVKQYIIDYAIAHGKIVND